MCRSLTLGSVLHLAALLLALEASGEPVLQSDATPTLTPLTSLTGSNAEAGRANPAEAAPLPGAAATPADTSRPGVTPVKRPTPTVAASAQPTPPVDEARDPVAAVARTRANTAALRSAASAKAAASEPVAGTDANIEIDPELKQAVKTTLQWAHDAKQWVEPGHSGTADGGDKSAESAAVLAARVAAAAADSRGAEYPPPNQQARLYGASAGDEFDPVREGLKLLRDIADHPVTWLLIPLLAFGLAAASLLQRGAKLARRRTARRHRNSAGASRRPHQSRSAAPSAIPPSMPPSMPPADAAPVRTRLRRSTKRR